MRFANLRIDEFSEWGGDQFENRFRAIRELEDFTMPGIHMNRRIFLKSGAMAMLSLGFAPSFLGRAAAAAGSRRKLLIAIFQRGAVDGLNMIVPHGESEYYRLRPTIAIPRPGGDLMGSAIDLDGFFGLHPSMAPLKPLWDNHSLAIVH